MKANLNKILAALQHLEQNPNFGDRPFVPPNQDRIAEHNVEETSTKTEETVSAPIPPLKPGCKAPTLPPFIASSEENSPKVTNLETPPPTLTEELQQVIQQIKQLYGEGPIVDGWLESYPCESASSNDQSTINDAVQPLEYVKTGMEQDKVICEAPRSCYRLNGVSETGQSWSYPCPLTQLPSVSLAIARYEKLLQLVDRKWDLETRLKQL